MNQGNTNRTSPQDIGASRATSSSLKPKLKLKAKQHAFLQLFLTAPFPSILALFWYSFTEKAK